MNRVVDGSLEHLLDGKFGSLKPISRADIPMGRGRGHASDLNDMQLVKDVNDLLTHVVQHGVSPYEIVREIDISAAEVQKQKKSRKSFTESLRALLKKTVEEHGLAGKIDVREYNKGERFFLVGREA